MSGQRPKAQKELAFEEAMDRLEALVTELEGGDLPLEQSLERFEEGVRLVRFCTDRLRAAELRVKELEDTFGGVRETPLDVEEE